MSMYGLIKSRHPLLKSRFRPLPMLGYAVKKEWHKRAFTAFKSLSRKQLLIKYRRGLVWPQFPSCLRKSRG
jgi:hypothetical protein